MFAQQAKMTWSSPAYGLALLAMIGILGCNPSAPPKVDSHSHNHAAHGPHGGHLVHLEPTGVQAEWAHDDDSGKLSVYLEEAIQSGKKIDEARIELEVTGSSKKTYDLVANDKNVYELVSPELLTAIEVGAGDAAKVIAKLIVTIDGKEEAAAMEHHEHSH
jgi:hypothetical protein